MSKATTQIQHKNIRNLAKGDKVEHNHLSLNPTASKDFRDVNHCFVLKAEKITNVPPVQKFITAKQM